MFNFGGTCEKRGIDNNVVICPAAVDEFFAVHNGLANNFGKERNFKPIFEIAFFAGYDADKHGNCNNHRHGL